MKANEFERELSWYISHGHADDDVVIHCKEPSMGAVAAENIAGIDAGFDWDAGRILLEPSKPLIHHECNRDVPKSIVRIEYIHNYDGKVKSTYHCPVCQCRVQKGDKYCRTCGQRLDSEKIETVSL